jgi:hypothetical protein
LRVWKSIAARDWRFTGQSSDAKEGQIESLLKIWILASFEFLCIWSWWMELDMIPL